MSSLKLPDGSKYQGALVGGKRHGIGTCTYPTGDTYEGAWRDDLRDGKGVLTLACGAKTDECVWSQDKPPSPLKFKCPNGDTIRADYISGYLKGQIKYTFASGAVLRGTLERGQPVGDARYEGIDKNVNPVRWTGIKAGNIIDLAQAVQKEAHGSACKCVVAFSHVCSYFRYCSNQARCFSFNPVTQTLSCSLCYIKLNRQSIFFRLR
jgi:hypothetical protein